MEIVKAEFLWSRKCNLTCGYCAMADGRSNTPDMEQWERGLVALQNLGCSFVAIYGAEPLLEFEKLVSLVSLLNKHGMSNTVITGAGISRSEFDHCLNMLIAAGLKSLSMSYDIIPPNASSKRKSMAAIENLRRFKFVEDHDNAAAIATITRLNYLSIPETITKLTTDGIWFLFDFIHPYRGQPGSKCKSYPGIDYLLFQNEHLDRLVRILEMTEKMKDQGFLCHSSRVFLDMLIADPTKLLRYDWNCADEDNFPAWVTVDCDGRVYPCDDFQMRISSPNIYVWEIDRRWEEFCDYWKPTVKKWCTGCLWNTHIDAHAIKRGVVPITDYVHER